MARKKRALKSEPFLIKRWGGLGDLMFCTPVIRRLSLMGYSVHVATTPEALPLLENNPHVTKAWGQSRGGPIGFIDDKYPSDLTEYDGYAMPTLGSLGQYYAGDGSIYPFNAVDYYQVIEVNSPHALTWDSQNSDFINAYDLHFSWAHIDPCRVPAHERRPLYYPTRPELEWAAGVLRDFPRPVIMLQPYASAPPRTLYRVTDMLDVLKELDNVTVLLWEPAQEAERRGNWRVMFSVLNGETNPVNALLPWPDSITPHDIRATAALITRADLLVSADTCVSHLAEAVRTLHLTCYTTVPAWTRSRDYEYEFTVESTYRRNKKTGELCKCCSVASDCLLKSRQAFKALSKRELELLSLLNDEAREADDIPKLPPVELNHKQPHEYFGTTPHALAEEVNSTLDKLASLRHGEALCSASIDLARVLTDTLNSERFATREAK